MRKGKVWLHDSRSWRKFSLTCKGLTDSLCFYFQIFSRCLLLKYYYVNKISSICCLFCGTFLLLKGSWCFLSNRSRLKLFFAYLRILNWSIFFLCTFRLHKRLHLSFYCNYSYFRNLLFSILIVFDERWFINIAINKMSLRRECQGGMCHFQQQPQDPHNVNSLFRNIVWAFLIYRSQKWKTMAMWQIKNKYEYEDWLHLIFTLEF